MQSFNNGDPTGHGKMRAGALRDLSDGFDVLVDGSTVAWDCDNRKLPQAKLTSTQSFTINMTNVISGAEGVFKLITSTSSAITITFDTDFTNKRLGAIGEETFTTYTFQAATGKEYILSFVVEGTTIHWVINETGWISWSPTFAGFSANPTVTARYMIIGKMFLFYLATTSLGTSNSTAAGGTTFTLPSGITNGGPDVHIVVGRINDAGSQSAPGVAVVPAASGTVTVYKNSTFGTAWGTGGTKGFALQGFIQLP